MAAIGRAEPGEVPANNQYVEATGPVAAVQKAFAVGLGVYQVDGQQVRGTDRDLSVPDQLAGVVTGVIGADQGQALVRPDHIGREQPWSRDPEPPCSQAGDRTSSPDGFRNAPPCSAFWAEKIDTTDPAYGGGYPSHLPYAPCGYTPPQFREVYGVQKSLDSGLDGRSAKGRHHRCVRRADDLRGRKHLRPAQ